jgi:hypothetical protein
MLIRFHATVANLSAGIRAFPRNWQYLAFSTDILQAPELIPNLPKTHELQFEKFWNDLDFNDLSDILISVLYRPVLYLPSLLYRYSLKSTAWLYLPLIYIAYLPGKLRGVEGRKVWVGYAGRTFLDWLGVVAALAALVVAVHAAIDLPALAELGMSGAVSGLPVTPLLGAVGCG